MPFIKRHLASLVLTSVVAVGGATTWASAAATEEPAADRRHHRPPGALTRRAIHGDLIVRGRDGQFESVTIDRGTVESKDGDRFTVKRQDGETVEFRVNDETVFRGVDGFEQLQPGRPAFVVSKDGLATHVAQRTDRRNRERAGTVEG